MMMKHQKYLYDLSYFKTNVHFFHVKQYALFMCYMNMLEEKERSR